MLVGVGGAALVTAGAVLVATAPVENRGRAESAALVFGDAVDQALVLGSAYRREVPADPVVSEPAALPAHFVPPGEPDAMEWFTTSDQALLREATLDTATRDVAASRVYDLHGWILPRSVLQLCAIAASGG